jgi:hypothetical protein
MKPFPSSPTIALSASRMANMAFAIAFLARLFPHSPARRLPLDGAGREGWSPSRHTILSKANTHTGVPA